ncbi:MAG: pyridoxal phosphate-dependent aminotransferase [Deltaproteobacteria bacterium]|nr:pyridoxal phosphate-dependent aminotransferase [Deltaproteobacteria bacterium]
MSWSQRIDRVKPSPTLAASARASALTAQGISVINFGVGEPDFDTPPHIKTACIEALHNGATKYGPVPGLPALRTAICEKLQRTNGVTYVPHDILVTCGAKEALFAALQVLINPGDEVLIPAPYWVSYADQTLLCDGLPTIIATDEAANFKLTPPALRRACTAKSRVLMLNTPSNPSGIVYTHDELEALAIVCAEKNLWVISDEIYEALVYPPATFCSFATAAPQCRDRTILVNGVSKSYAMTGWRIGWAAGPEAVITQMGTWQGQVVTHACAFAQHGAIAAYTGPQDALETMRAAFQERRNVMAAALRNIPGITCVEPRGAFYAYPNVTALLGRSVNGRTIATSEALTEYLLEDAHISVVAGEGFGTPGYLRFSYALGMADLKEGLARFAAAVSRLRV